MGSSATAIYMYIYMPLVGFEPTISADERPQTYALYIYKHTLVQILVKVFIMTNS